MHRCRRRLAARWQLSLPPLLRTPPAPRTAADPFSLLVVMTERHPFLGKVVTGRVAAGSVGLGDRLKVLWKDGERWMADGACGWPLDQGRRRRRAGVLAAGGVEGGVPRQLPL